MYWLALYLPPDMAPAEQQAWRARALHLTPRVALVDEALVLEVSASLRLWGGAERLLRQLLGSNWHLALIQYAQAATFLVAIALLRLKRLGLPHPALCPQQLPLSVLSAAQPHVGTLARVGCTTWGDLRALPRAGVARRFGLPLLEALDAAHGERPETCTWLTLPEDFDLRLELPALATTAPELMWTAQRLLSALQAWLRARQRGVLAVELEWALDLKRLDGVQLPPTQQLTLRTAQPTQATDHLRRLVGEHLARATLAAPANALRLRTLETAPWAGASTSLLPQDLRKGERLHELVERLSVRLGAEQVRWPQTLADHRPEHRQRWVNARDAQAQSVASPVGSQDALLPTWLLREPLPLRVVQGVPQFQGALQTLTSPQRIEGGWWDTATADGTVLRDYFVARSAQSGLLWIYRERAHTGPAERWFLHGAYA
ncbi:MAG: DNA polymerase Y family protein [Rhodoferax sp.]|nr:DNA polymerase Y family protein [Rhodoferax sp.]